MKQRQDDEVAQCKMLSNKPDDLSLMGEHGGRRGSTSASCLGLHT